MSNDNKKLMSGQALQELYDAMDDERKRSLADFAEYMYAQAEPVSKELLPPVDIPRPEAETVVGAIKRLKAKYHMISSMSVFSAASSLMTEHMVSGRNVNEVIDEMEILFEDSYQELVKEHAEASK